jgi:hypothetical protein
VKIRSKWPGLFGSWPFDAGRRRRAGTPPITCESYLASTTPLAWFRADNVSKSDADILQFRDRMNPAHTLDRIAGTAYAQATISVDNARPAATWNGAQAIYGSNQPGTFWNCLAYDHTALFVLGRRVNGTGSPSTQEIVSLRIPGGFSYVVGMRTKGSPQSDPRAEITYPAEGGLTLVMQPSGISSLLWSEWLLLAQPSQSRESLQANEALDEGFVNSPASILSPAAQLRMGGNPGVAASYWRSDFQDFVVWDRALEDIDVNAVGFYLACRYGVSWPWFGYVK